jgi:simple sugar transport system substrate-binding protein
MMLKGQEIKDGVNLGVPGYENITIKKNASGVPVVYGQAWVDVDINNLKDWTNPNGTYIL